MSEDSLVCAPCYVFRRHQDGKDKAFSSRPVTDWSNLAKLIKKHNESKEHRNAEIDAENFVLIMKGEKKDIRCSVSSHHNDVVTKNRIILRSIVETIILCGKQNIALRGHDEDGGNFKAILADKAKHNEVLKSHLEKSEKRENKRETQDSRITYMSPQIQNEIIEICGNMIKTSIVEPCIKSKFFGFIADEATDASTMEQMALCIRYYDVEKNKLEEQFIGFSECESTTGENLANAFIAKLQEAGLDIQNIRGQGYDGAANMSGCHRGVKTRIQQIVPEAIYTHCKAHNLNLAIIHASKNALVRNMLDIVQQITFHFNYSAKRQGNFQNCLATDAESTEAMQGRRKLRSLCETRWSARADLLFTFKSAFTTVCSSLEDLAQNQNDPKALNFLNAIQSFDFIVALVTTEHVLSGVAPLSLLLQKKDCDLLTASREARVVIDMLNAERADPMVWDALYAVAVDLANKVGVQPAAPRNPRRQQHRPNAPAQDPLAYWRINMYLIFVDHLVQEMQDRLVDGKERFLVERLIPKNIGALTQEDVLRIFETFRADLETDIGGFQTEVRRWTTMWGTTNVNQKPGTLEETIQNSNHTLYPSITLCLRIVLCMPVTTASAERAFSTMRRVKTYLRSSMTTERLSGLGLMAIYKQKASELDIEEVIDIFARKKDRKLELLF